MSDNFSRYSGSSKRSGRSATSAAVIARAKAEAAKVRAAFAEKETAMKVERVRLEASLEALRLEREAAAAIAEADALEAAAINQQALKEPHSTIQDYHTDISPESADERVRDYVNALPTTIATPESVITIQHEEPVPEPNMANVEQLPHAPGNAASFDQPQQPQKHPYQHHSPHPTTPTPINSELHHWSFFYFFPSFCLSVSLISNIDISQLPHTLHMHLHHLVHLMNCLI